MYLDVHVLLQYIYEQARCKPKSGAKHLKLYSSIMKPRLACFLHALSYIVVIYIHMQMDIYIYASVWADGWVGGWVGNQAHWLTGLR